MDLFRLDNLLAPGLTLTSEFRPAPNGVDRQFENRLDLSLPLKGTVGVRTDLGELFTLDHWKDLTRIVKPDIRQRFLDVGAGYGIRPETEIFSREYSEGIKTIEGYVGVSGLRYLDKRYFLLWGARAMYAESVYTLDKPGVRVSASAGTARFTKTGFIYYYGAAATYNDGRFLAIPWAGGQARLPWGSRVRVILPREVVLRHRFGRDKLWQKADWEVGLRADARYRAAGATSLAFCQWDCPLGYRGPVSLEVWELKTGASLAWRIPDSQSWLQLYAGYTPVRWLTVEPDDRDDVARVRITPSNDPAIRRPFVELSFTTSLGKDVLNLDMGNLLFSQGSSAW
ncbi:MAG: hypothetical protein GC205_06230 [Bacteroidetes bacterium]|nr:hypothetical protein [Bacteroidota bacterium]